MRNAGTCITTNSSGCKEVIKDNINGFICDKNDGEDLALKMEKMLGLTSEQLKEMGCKGREIVVNKFDIKFVVQNYEHVLTKLSAPTNINLNYHITIK